MKIQLETQGFDLTEAIDAHARSQLHFHLAAFKNDVVSVAVFLSGINGPKGAPDKKVLIRVRLSSLMTVTVERTRSDLYVALTDAARQTKRAVRRSLSRHRRMERRALRELNRLPQG